MIRRPPRSTRTDTLFPTRRSSDLGGDADVERHISINALTLDVVGEADHRGLGDQRVEHQRAFDLGGAHAVARDVDDVIDAAGDRSEEHPSELQSLMRLSSAVFCLKKKNKNKTKHFI